MDASNPTPPKASRSISVCSSSGITRQVSHVVSDERSEQGGSGFRSLLRNKRNVLVLACLSFVNFTVLCSYTMLAPFFPNEGKKKGISLTLTGLIFAVFPFVVVSCSPMVGKMIPVLGPRFTLIAGLFIEGSSQVIFAFVDLMPNRTTFITFCFLVRITTAFGSSMTGTANLTIVADSFGEHIALAFGILETFLGLGVMLGPPLGGFLYSVGGFRLPFLTIGGSILAVIVLVVLVLPRPEGSEDEQESGSLGQALKIPAVLVVAFVVVMTGIVISFLDPTLSLHLKPFHLSTGQVGLMFLVMNGFYTLTAPWLGALSGKWGTRIMMSFGCWASAVSYFLIGPSPILQSSVPNNLWLNGVALAICGVGLSMLIVPAITDMNKSAFEGGMPESLGTRGVISGIFNSMFNVGATLGPTVAGTFSEYLGFPWATTTISFLMLLMGIILFSFTKYEARKRRAEATDDERCALIANA